jgi:tRNA(fMet)-specific endonuclease VapC
MFVLDTDHVSLLERAGSVEANRLRRRLEQVPVEERATTIVSFEEQTRGWMSYLAKARSLAQQIEAYRRLKRQLDSYCAMMVLDFDETAASEFQRLFKLRLRIGTMDLKIAAIALARHATLLTRNQRDFRNVPGLASEDWAS